MKNSLHQPHNSPIKSAENKWMQAKMYGRETKKKEKKEIKTKETSTI